MYVSERKRKVRLRSDVESGSELLDQKTVRLTGWKICLQITPRAAPSHCDLNDSP